MYGFRAVHLSVCIQSVTGVHLFALPHIHTPHRVPHVVQDLTTRHHAEVLLHVPHDDGVGHGTEQSLCARATSTLESMTGVTMPMVMCELPIEVSVCSAERAGRASGYRGY